MLEYENTMDIFQAVILGIVQGLTEFIPVSSSGHLIILREFLGIHGADLAVDAVLQLATILAVFSYFFNDFADLGKAFVRLLSGKIVSEEDKRMLAAIALGTIPALILGLILEDKMETIFRDSHLVAIMLLLGSGLMFLAEILARQNSGLTAKKGIVIGFFQALALIPGVSRSGATISGGLLTGLDRSSATRFSFLLAFPIILGSGLKQFIDLFKAGELSSIGPTLGVGFLVSFIVGLLAIHYLLRYLKHHRLTVFIWYRIILAFLILILF